MKVIKCHSNYSPRSFNGFEGFFDDFLTRDWGIKYEQTYSPAVNVLENEQSFEIHVAASGFRKEEFSLNIENRKLHIIAERKAETKDEAKENQPKFIRREFGATRFERLFALPKNVDVENISANYEEGVLKISIPKLKEEVAPKRNIEVL